MLLAGRYLQTRARMFMYMAAVISFDLILPEVIAAGYYLGKLSYALESAGGAVRWPERSSLFKESKYRSHNP